MGFAGVILAAGESTRMGRDKALLPWPPPPENSNTEKAGSPSRSTLLAAVIEETSRFSDLVIVVAGKNQPTLEPIVFARGAFIIRNPAPEQGQFSSLQIGLREVLNRGRDAAVVALVDRPPANAETIAKLLDAFEKRSRGIWAIVPEFSGKHGHPIVIGREMIEAFLRAPATANARDIKHANPSRIAYVPVNDASITLNLNTPEDYAALGTGL
jgi:molybdenum cofactor cytidylyltransferase